MEGAVTHPSQGRRGMRRVSRYGTALFIVAAVALGSPVGAEVPDPKLEGLSPNDARSTPAPEELPPVVAKACADVGDASEQRGCGLELIPILRTPRERDVAPPAPAARLSLGLNLGDACSRYYSEASRRAGDEGFVVLLLYIGRDGRVRHVLLWQSSGIDRLDVATASCVSREGRFLPRTVDRMPVGSWQRFRYEWRLH